MLIEARIISSFYKYKRKFNFLNQIIIQQQRTFTTTESSKDGVAKKLKILFFGTDSFSLPSLQELHKKKETPSLGVVTSFKNPSNLVRTYAERQKIPLYRWPVAPDICGNYDLGVVVSFGHLIPEHIINSFPLGMINVHASLLPRWRGAAPIIYAIMHGDKETGVSIMRIEPKKFDIGDILAQHNVPISADTLMPELHARLASDGAALLTNIISEYPASFQNTIKQNNAAATLAPKITPAITELHWSSMSATEVYNRYRALYGFKHLSTKFRGKSIQIVELAMADDKLAPNIAVQSGSFFYRREQKCLQVCCANQSFVEVHQLRIEGKKVMSAADFNNGFLRKLNAQELLFSDK